MFRLTPKKIRYTVVSISATTIDFGVLLLLHASGLSLIKSNYVSSTCGFIYSYIANRRFTFKTTDRGVKREFVLYIIVSLIGIWAIQPIVLYLVEPALNQLITRGWIVAIIAKIIAALVTFVWNYLLYTRIVFARK